MAKIDEAHLGRRVLTRLWDGHEMHSGIIVEPPAGMDLPASMVCIQFDPPVKDIHNVNTWIISLTREASRVDWA